MKALVIDLDGVLRRWDALSPVEARAGLPEGAILRTAFDPELLGAATTGVMPDEEWRAAVAERLHEQFGVDGGEVVAAWSAPYGTVDHEVLAVIRRARRRVRVALLTNATSRLSDDLTRLGLVGEFDTVCNSYNLGVAKPDPLVFTAAADALGVATTDCLFVDDTCTHVEAAAAVGMVVHRFVDARGLQRFLDAHLS